MATGLSKTKWNSKAKNSSITSRISGNISDVSLSYINKQSKDEILKTNPALLSLLWENTLGQENKQSFNHLYYGDNLPILAALLQNPSIRGQVRLIYIDPPFATNSVFQSRTQNDAYDDLLNGANYIEFLRARLLLLRELLADDGSIYVHLDDNMAFYIKVIMDEIFGKENFRSWITRKKCNPKNYTRKTYGNISDFILFYTKSDNYVWNRPVEAWTDERAEKEYQYIEKETGRHYKKVPVHAPGTRNGETGLPWRGKLPPPGKHWQFPPRTLDEMDAKGEIYWSPTGNPRRKIYLDASEGIPVQDIWLEFRDAHNQNIAITGYPTEKNPELLARIIKASSHPGDLVLDCFSGSGTTLAVASELKRKWIGIDNSTEALATTLRRFAKGLELMGNFVSQQEPQSSKMLALQSQLWESSKEQEEVQIDRITFHAINDFSLFSEEAVKEDLEDVLQQWLAWQ